MKLFAFLVALASVAVAGADASAFLATDKNFDSAVMNSGKHVFVKYLAPWYARDATRRDVNARTVAWRVQGGRARSDDAGMNE
jgi:hypothetical protein